MIRTLVVEDDFRVAELHRDYTERVPGFTVVGTATTGAEALALAATLSPDLLLLDIHLPDISGIEVIRSLRQRGQAADVIAITAAKEVETLRAAMQGGVVHYLVKPFRFAAFGERLRTYATARERLSRLSEADQREVDRLFALLRSGAAEELPKGLAPATLDLVVRALRSAGSAISAEDVATAAGLSRVTARRYLDHLAQKGQVELRMRYGGPGRPEHRYQLIAG
ncbi:MAG TPA: response regulator [Candidatus Dormibacteraeota bacterium]|jgi:two-component system CitB family response regulator|nr:response regulator [Candidatus Dormibacteraeota bacterium]